jgi:hypothetical protein
MQFEQYDFQRSFRCFLLTQRFPNLKYMSKQRSYGISFYYHQVGDERGISRKIPLFWRLFSKPDLNKSYKEN